MENAPKIEEYSLKSHWVLKKKYQEIMEELYTKIQNNQSIPPNSLPQMQSPMFSGSYEEWIILKNRYQNNRLIIARLLDKIFDSQNIIQISAHKTRSLE
ncbi:hypothetical protein JTB14_027555 [Gonioctena quinquepunctata]|nr:hypothetical protein JTB14_027555 [Gonioctena quinquepunctata]